MTDHGFRQALGFSNTRDIERTLENIVYTELKARGYEVYVGKTGGREIDFVAQKHHELEYYQVSYLMESESTRRREFSVYDGITDHYPKFVISMDKVDFSQNGIIHKHIIDFLMDDVRSRP